MLRLNAEKGLIMRVVFFRTIITMLICFSSCYSQSLSAAADVEILNGKIQTVLNKKDISVFLLDKDRSILDIAGLDNKGNFSLDLTIMDDPVYDELIKLNIRIALKNGVKKEVKISKVLEEFVDRKIKVETITLP